MMIIHLPKLYKKITNRLEKHGISHPTLEARILLATILKIQAYQVHTLEDVYMSLKNKIQIYCWLRALLQHKPTSYLLKNKEFYSLNFYVNRRTFIPRPETEELVEWIYRLHAKRKIYTILDMCCGSGCIGITLATLLNPSLLYLIDKSYRALRAAEKNTQYHIEKEMTTVTLLKSNLFDRLDKSKKSYKNSFDIIVSNPPYILPQEKHLLTSSVIKYEPRQALFLPNKHFIRKLIQQSHEYLNQGGWLYLENHPNQMDDIYQHLQSFRFDKIQIKKDLSGKKRFITAQKQ